MSFEIDPGGVVDLFPILPLKKVVLFPETVRSLFFNRPYSLAALKEAATTGQKIFAVTLRNPDIEKPKQSDFHLMGVIGKVVKLQRLPNGAIQALFQAEERGRLISASFVGPYYAGRVEKLSSRESACTELPHLVHALKAEFFKYLESEQKTNQFQWHEELGDKDVPAGRFADAVAPFLKISLTEQQEILATLDTRERVEMVYTFLLREAKQKEYERNLKARVEEQIDKRQKEYYLNEQMKAIQEELGGQGEESEFEIIQKAIEETGMPEAVREVAEKELQKLKKMGNFSHEATPVRNYLDWLTSVPWSKRTEDNLDLNNAEEILDADHFGLEKAKERILEYIAVANAVGQLKGPIICLSGPPGVGKTSLGRSIARALNRNFARVSLGGVRDEAEIRGHRRTYIGALPGKIIQTMKKVKSINPLILLDEIDKLSHPYMGGGPIAALLEVLDPEQNNSFMDHYFEVEYDLSKVLFICTANDLASVPLPLRDRMEIIELSGYTELEKVEIAKRYLLPKQMEENGLKKGDLLLKDRWILEVIRGYTREAGVRGLERTLSKVCRKAVTERIKAKVKESIAINAKKIEGYLGPARFQHNLIEKTSEIGMVTGLAWTSVGGETLSIEVSTIKGGSGKVQLTGTLGEVMKESAQAAISYVRANANPLGIYSKAFKDLDIHIHVPAGGTPKDGPSAGIALAAGLVSALTRIPIHWDVALTGEVTLRGGVLPIGGLKEKLLAAKRAHIRRVLIPQENEKDLVEIPDEILKDLEIQPVRHLSEVFPALLERLPLEVREEDAPHPAPRDLVIDDGTPIGDADGSLS